MLYETVVKMKNDRSERGKEKQHTNNIHCEEHSADVAVKCDSGHITV